MKAEDLKPNIMRIALRQEKGDPDYGRCLWAYYDFDIDNCMLSIQSDRGNAGYRWPDKSTNNGFLQMMARVDDDYLLGKLFVMDEVDIAGTVDAARETLGIGKYRYEDDMMTFDEYEKRKAALSTLEYELGNACGYGETLHIIEEWYDDNGFEVNDPDGLIQMDYTSDQKQIVKLFMEYVQPRIKEIIYKETYGGRRGE